MKSFFVILVGLATTAVAQISGFPTCATECLATMLTSCTSSDLTCLCNRNNVILQLTLMDCIKMKCSDADQKKTDALGKELCASVTTTLPTETLSGATTTTLPTETYSGATTTGSHTSTGTITSAPTTTHTGSKNGTNQTTPTTTHTSTSTGAAASGYVASGLGVAGAAVAAFLFL